ncbi:MAG: ATP-dependent DNA ligase [Alphaproteobacteria bacterium]|nr:ATP-dependent DNA ligase [Alphaproteobacteria bacterium]|tara:strand:- start:1605 stop:2498 length:894 start_codon:yes stop_codon:yes gene_type:complete
MATFKPLLAETIDDTSKLDFSNGVLVSTKIDGIRVTVHDGVVMSRSMKPIRSPLVQEKFGKLEYNGLDGELVYGDPYAKDAFNATTKVVMSGKIPAGTDAEQLTLFVFDRFDLDMGFEQRYNSIRENYKNGVVRLEHRLIHNNERLMIIEAEELEKGAEGLMVRKRDGRYKQGRSTVKEGILLKVKRFVDEEAKIIDFEELMHNANEGFTNELGRTARSTAQEGLVPMDTLGAVVMWSEKWGKFRIGTGFTADERKYIWTHKEEFLNEYGKFKHFPIGGVDKPRFGVWLGKRDKDDM